LLEIFQIWLFCGGKCALNSDRLTPKLTTWPVMKLHRWLCCNNDSLSAI
jgi:hypothetical protein